MVHAGVVSLAPDNPYEVAKVERPEEFTAAQFALQWFAASDLQLVNQPVAMRALAWDEQPEGVRQEQIDRMQIVLDRMVADGVLAIV